jgi:hypothetical protein
LEGDVVRETVQTTDQNQQNEKNIEQEKQRDQEKLSIRMYKPSPLLDYANNELSIDSPALANCSANPHLTSANKLFKTKLFSGQLYFLENAWRFAMELQKMELIKPIEYLLVVKNPAGNYYYAISELDASTYAKQLNDPKIKPACSLALVALGSDPFVMREFGLSREKQQELIGSSEFQKVLSDIGIINGTYYAPHELLNRLKKSKKSYSELCQLFLAKQAFPSESALGTFKFLNKIIKDEIKIDKEKIGKDINFTEINDHEIKRLPKKTGSIWDKIFKN